MARRAAAAAADSLDDDDAADEKSIRQHRAQLESLAERDPDFYAYLKETDEDLLAFGGSEEDSSDAEEAGSDASEDEAAPEVGVGIAASGFPCSTRGSPCSQACHYLFTPSGRDMMRVSETRQPLRCGGGQTNTDLALSGALRRGVPLCVHQLPCSALLCHNALAHCACPLCCRADVYALLVQAEEVDEALVSAAQAAAKSPGVLC